MRTHPTRREFLRLTTGTVVAAATLGPGILRPARADATARVIVVRHADAVGAQGKVNGEVVQAMLDEAVGRLLGTGNATDAWRGLVKPTDVVGIKSNGWYRLPTPPELEAAIRRRVQDAGVAEQRLDVADSGVCPIRSSSRPPRWSTSGRSERTTGPAWGRASKTTSSSSPTGRRTTPMAAPPWARSGRCPS